MTSVRYKFEAILKKTLMGLCVCMIIFPLSAQALTPEDRKYLFTPFYDPNSGDAGSCATLLPGNDNEEKVWNYLVSKGMTTVQAAGSMGNLKHEGSFNPTIVERGHMEGNTWRNSNPIQFPLDMDTIPPHNLAPIVSGRYAGQPGYGIVQWTSPGRKDGLQAFSDNDPSGRGVNDLGLQLDYMWFELSGAYKARALDPLLAATDLAEATRIWQEKYEVGRNFEPRFRDAQDFLAKYGSGTPASTSGGGGATTSCGSGGPVELDENGCPSEPIPESETVVVQGIRVHPCIAEEVDRVVALANSRGLNMSGWGWRDTERQKELRIINGCPDVYTASPSTCRVPTAIPGRSKHERGSAVDFTCNGSTIKSRSHPCFIFLDENTSLINLPSEPWHWSINGG